MIVLLSFKIQLPITLLLHGLALSIIGMCVGNMGLTYGLGAIGGQAGSTLPAAFMEVSVSEVSPIYNEVLGLSIVILFVALVLVQLWRNRRLMHWFNCTRTNNGAFKVLFNVHCRRYCLWNSLRCWKNCFNDLATVLIPLYLLAVVLTYFSTEEFVNAWDSAGVTTGPVTVPLVLAMGLGLEVLVGD